MELTLERFKIIRSLAEFLFDGYFIVFRPLFFNLCFYDVLRRLASLHVVSG